MFVSNTELLKKLLQVENKMDDGYDSHRNNKNNDEILSKLEKIEQRLNNIDANVNHIFFENQVIKHQLLLEDRIIESINEIDNLSIIIKSSVSKIDLLLNNNMKN